MQSELRAAQKRNQLLELATSCLAERPNASLNEIAAYADIGIATLHRYFKSRDQLLKEISFRAIELVNNALAHVDFSEPVLETFFSATISQLLPLADRMYFLTAEAFKLDDDELNTSEGIVRQRFICEFRRRQAAGQLRADIPAEWMFSVVYALLFSSWSDIYNGVLAPKQAAALLCTTLIDGIKQA